MLKRLHIPLLDRYILKQLLDFFLLSLVLLSLVGFFSDTFLDFIRDIQKLGIPMSTALTLVGLQMPATLAFVIPAATFLATIMVYNTLNNQFEIIAFRVNGISLKRLVIPAMVLGLMSSVTAYVLGDSVIPYCNQQAELLKEDAIHRGSLPFGQESVLFKTFDDHYTLQQMVYIGHSHGHRLRDATILDMTRPRVMQIIQARSGFWYPDRWEFNNANAYTISKTKQMLVFNHLDKFSLRNLFSKADEDQSIEDPPSIRLDSDTQSFRDLWKTIQQHRQQGRKVVSKTYIKMWERITMPLSCLVIVLTAVPLALSAPRQRVEWGYILAVGVLFLYYLLRSISVALGRSEMLTFGGALPFYNSLALAAWLPLLLIAFIGAGLLIRRSKVL